MTLLDAGYKAKAWCDSYNHHLDMVDFWHEQARRSEDMRDEYLSLARLHDDECVRLIGDLARSGWELSTDDDGHIAPVGEQLALAV